MNKVGTYVHDNRIIELYFDNETFMFIAEGARFESPEFSTALEAINNIRHQLDIEKEHSWGEPQKTEYKKLTNPTKKPKQRSNLEILEVEMWSLDSSFAQWALPRVLYFKNFCSQFSIPGDFVVMDNNYNQLYIAYDEWEEILTYIVTGLRYMVDDCTTLDKKENAAIEKALKLFRQYIRGMWT